jgi:hypothetical protein
MREQSGYGQKNGLRHCSRLVNHTIGVRFAREGKGRAPFQREELDPGGTRSRQVITWLRRKGGRGRNCQHRTGKHGGPALTFRGSLSQVEQLLALRRRDRPRLLRFTGSLIARLA